MFNGKGKYWWPIGRTGGSSSERHCYTGDWADGKMQGKGEFKHTDGHTLKGYFAKNLFVEVQQGKKYYLNPLDSKDQHQTFIKKS